MRSRRKRSEEFMRCTYPARRCAASRRPWNPAASKNSAGTMEWTTSNLRTILSDEKYCGDVLLQKTFIQDCISKKVIKNTGQLPMYLIQNHHEAIIPRDRFDAVQVELARRKTLTSSTKKERSHRHEPLQRQIRTQRSAVLRRVRYGVPQSGVDTAR
ncbi:MAG: recombinase family protein [Dysosmobacter sp.]